MNIPTTQTFHFQLNAEQTAALLNFIPNAKMEMNLIESDKVKFAYANFEQQVKKQLNPPQPKPVMQPLPKEPEVKETTPETPTE